MRALILAGGKGTRLIDITKGKYPKPMINIGGKPLLHHHINLLKKHGITEIWINVSVNDEVIKKYFDNGHKYGVNIFYSEEHEPLGTSGALVNNNSKIKETFLQGDFLVIYGDNLTNINYKELINTHKSKDNLLTMGLFKSIEPWTQGVVELDQNNNVVSMIEKPPKETYKSDLVNAGIYVCNKEVINLIPKGFSDFGFDILPKIAQKNKLGGYLGDFFLQDIGTPDRLKIGLKLFEKNPQYFV